MSIAEDTQPEENEELKVLDEPMSEASSILKAMASETRLKILCALSDGEKPVNHLADVTGQSLPAISQHLAKLRATGLVASRREAQTIYYYRTAGVGSAIIQTLCDHYR